MTITELEQTAAALAAIDRQLGALPARGRVRQEVQANRVALGETAKLVALALREAQAAGREALRP